MLWRRCSEGGAVPVELRFEGHEGLEALGPKLARKEEARLGLAVPLARRLLDLRNELRVHVPGPERARPPLPLANRR